jgi:nicotinamidase-related amidase
MPEFADRPNTALLVLDAGGPGGPSRETRRPEQPAGLGGLVARARAAQVPVVWVRRTAAGAAGSTGAAAQIGPRGCEAVVGKSHGDPFEGTALEAVLCAHTVGHLVVAGTRADARMRSTLHGAFVRGYHVTLVGTAGAPQRSAAFVDAELIDFA